MASASSEQPRVPSPNDEDEDDFAETLRLRAMCGRFRILVIGRANAGKTTLCQRMCNTTDPPVVYSKGGKIVNVSPSEERGIHNIEDEIVYEANPGFVFHDSGGFESGSEAELQAVRDFIKRRSEASELSSRLHAIWFCMPVDSDRPLVDAEMKFFESGTHPVPVIAIFTKCDSLYVKAKEYLREKGLSRRDITKQAIEEETETYLRMLETDWNKRAIYRPKAYCFMKGLEHVDDESFKQCAALVERTEEFIDDDVLKLLFASVQRCNTKICVRHAVKYSLHNYESKASSTEGWQKRKTYQKYLVATTYRFPHILIGRRRVPSPLPLPVLYESSWGGEVELELLYPPVLYESRVSNASSLVAAFMDHIGPPKSLMEFLLCMAGFIIVTEYSFWYQQSKKGKTSSSWEKDSVHVYLSSGMKERVKNALSTLKLSMPKAQLEEQFLKVVLDNLLPRPGLD